MKPAAATVLRDIAARVDDAPSVARRSGGLLGTAAAHLPGDRIEGLRVRAERLEIHVVMTWKSRVDDVERDVLDAVGDRWDLTLVDLVVEDIDAPDQMGLSETGNVSVPALEPGTPTL